MSGAPRLTWLAAICQLLAGRLAAPFLHAAAIGETGSVTSEVVSSVEDILWPALPDPRGTAILALLYQLEQTQWWPAERLAARQLEQAGALLAHAHAEVSFYRERLGAAGVDPSARLSSETWSRLPILRRAEIQAAGQQLFSQALPPAHGSVSEIFTSGSTGKPIRALRSQLWSLFWSAFTLRDHLWHGRDLGGKLAAIRESGAGQAPYPEGERSPSWGRASGAAFRTGPSVSLNITCPVEQQAEWLRRENPHYLLTHPSMAERLASHCLDEGIELPNLHQVETISERLRPRTRELCREAWDVPLVDMYSAREAGYIALQCPETDHYHVQSEGVLVEVLDEAGRSCAAGEVGRVVVTPLHNFAMPLLRYEIGDYAEVGGPCSCGRGLPVLRRILGRRQNMLVLPSGEERWPLLSSSDIDGLLARAPVRQYQFVQKNPAEIELRLAVARPLDTGEEEALRAWVRDKFGHPFDVRLAYVDEIPLTAAGKFEDFVCEVAR